MIQIFQPRITKTSYRWMQHRITLQNMKGNRFFWWRIPLRDSIYFKSQLEKEDYFYNGRIQAGELLENLTSYDLRTLIRTEDELACCTGFTRIFPGKNYTRWPQLFFGSLTYRPFSDYLISLTLICTGEKYVSMYKFIYLNFS